jgi:sulfhydrogenase subunit beta (sulfur reductase)
MSEDWRKLRTENVAAFLAELSRSREVLVPMRVNERWEFVPFQPKAEVAFPDGLIDVSLKRHFFPRRRPIATSDLSERWALEPIEPSHGTRVIIGLHPCDAAGIRYMDRVFLESRYPDRHYQAERDRTVLIGLTCAAMGPHCHCTDRNGSPDSSEGMDAVFTRVEGGFLFRPITPKGEAILQSGYLEATDEVPEKVEWPKGRLAVASPEAFMDMVDDPIWDELADICLTCGVCTFECPTCVCFGVSDEKFQGKGERVTVWDSCQFTCYSRMAGGHQPRPSNASRIRNRTLDKFAYSYQKHGQISCVGCGRCALQCPLDRSFPEIAAKISERIAEKAGEKTLAGAEGRGRNGGDR